MINTCIGLISRTCNANTEGKHAYRVVVSTPARRRHFGRCGPRGKDNINMDFREKG